MRSLASKGVLLFTVILASCNSETKESSKETYSLEIGKSDLKDDSVHTFKKTSFGAVAYSYHLLTASETSFEVNGEDKENKSELSMKLRFDIRKDSGENLLLKITYDQFHMKVKADKVEKELDAATAGTASDPTDRAVSVLNGAVVNAVISPKGKVQSVTSMQKLAEKIKLKANEDPEEAKAFQQALNKTFGDDYFKNLIEQNFKVYPDSPVAVGKSWTMESKLTTDIKASIKTVYTLRKIKDGIAYIDLAADIATHGEELVIEGTRAKVDLTGAQEGAIELDQATGMVLFSENTFSAKGSINVLGTDIPLKVKSTSTVKGKKL